MLLESHIHKMAIDLPLGGTNEFLPPPGRIPAPSDWNPQPGCAFLRVRRGSNGETLG